MSICDICQVRQERPCTYALRTKEFFDALMPALKFVARRYGYALAVHGSLKTDIDLIAAPWRDLACDAESLAEAIRQTSEQIIGTARIRHGDPSIDKPDLKPAGRKAWSFYLQPEGIDGPYIDLSVMPIGSHGPQQKESAEPKWTVDDSDFRGGDDIRGRAK